MPKAKANGIEIEYDCFGNTDAEAVLLISGLGTQMICWSETFCQILVEQGYRVIRFDNRDAGLSTHFDSASMPDLAAIADAVSRGEPEGCIYSDSRPRSGQTYLKGNPRSACAGFLENVLAPQGRSGDAKDVRR